MIRRFLVTSLNAAIFNVPIAFISVLLYYLRRDHVFFCACVCNCPMLILHNTGPISQILFEQNYDFMLKNLSWLRWSFNNISQLLCRLSHYLWWRYTGQHFGQHDMAICLPKGMNVHCIFFFIGIPATTRGP